MIRQPAKHVAKKVTTLSIRRNRQDQSGSPPAENTDLRDELAIAGIKAKQEKFNTRKEVNTLTLKRKSNKDGQGSSSPKNNSINKWNNSVMHSLASPHVAGGTDASPANNTNVNTLRKEKEEEEELSDKRNSENRPEVTNNTVELEPEHQSHHHHGSHSSNNYAKILKLGDTKRLDNKEKRAKAKKISNLLAMQQSSIELQKFGLTDMQSPQERSSNMDLPSHSPSAAMNNLGKSQSTFRRTPLRVRVEDLMTVNENQNSVSKGGERMSMSSTEDKHSMDEDNDQMQQQHPQQQAGRSDSFRLSKQVAAASKRFHSLITENSRGGTKKNHLKVDANNRTNSMAVSGNQQARDDQLGRNLAIMKQIKTRTVNQMTTDDNQSPSMPLTQDEQMDLSAPAEEDSRQLRHQKLHQESQRSFDMNARLAERLNQLPKLTTTSQMLKMQRLMQQQQQFGSNDTQIISSQNRKSSFYTGRHSPTFSQGLYQLQQPELVSYHMGQSNEQLANGRNQQVYPTLEINNDESQRAAGELQHEISISQLPNLPQLRTAINEDSQEDSMHNSYQPVSVPLSRNKENVEKRFLEDMKNLDQVLSQQTLLGIDSIQGARDQPSAAAERENRPKNAYDWNKQKEDESMAPKPVVLAQNLYNDQQKAIAKRIFMNRLGKYFESHHNNESSFELSTQGVNSMQFLSKQVTKIETPFFLMKRKKSIPAPIQRKRGSQSIEPNFQQVSFANLRARNETPVRQGQQLSALVSPTNRHKQSKSLLSPPKHFISQTNIASPRMPFGFSQQELEKSPVSPSQKVLLPQEKERILQGESRLYLNDSKLHIETKDFLAGPIGSQRLESLKSTSHAMQQQSSKLSIPQLSPFTPVRVPKSILSLSKRQIDASKLLSGKGAMVRGPQNQSALHAGERQLINDESDFIESNTSVRRGQSTLIGQQPNTMGLVSSPSQALALQLGAASFAQLSQAEQDEKVSQMNQYMQGLQSQISQSAFALSAELMSQQKKLLIKKDEYMPRKRQAHAYMYNRGLEDRDTVSMVYPNLNADGASSLYYASLTSSIHKLNGTKKRAKMMDDSSMQTEELSEQPQEEDPEEIERRKREERMKYRKKKDDTIIGKLKQQRTLGHLKEHEYQSAVGQSKTDLKLSRINSMVSVEHDPELKAKIKKDFRRLFDDYIETLVYREQVTKFPDYLHSEMDKVHARVEHPNVQQKILLEVLQDSAKLTDFMESLSHVKNEKTMQKIDEQPEFTKLVAFVNEFLDIKDLAKSKNYVNYLIDDLKIFSLLEMSNKHQQLEDQQKQKAKAEKCVKTEEPKLPEQLMLEDRDSQISFGERSSQESDYEDEVIESQSTRATFFSGQDSKSVQEFGVEANANLSKRLLKKMEFGAMMKKQVSPVNSSWSANEAKFQFCKEIARDSKLAMPLFDLEVNKLQELRITQVALSIQQIKALSSSMPLMPNISGLYMEDTNLSDEGFATILGCINSNIPSFRSISVKGGDNKFGKHSYPLLHQILQRRVPFQLTCLQLEGIKIEPSYSGKLLMSIQKFGLLEKLSLANLKLDTLAFKYLCAYLNKNYSLSDLNLRQLNMPVRKFAVFLPFLAENRKLQYLNISGNTLIDNNADVYDLFNINAYNEALTSSNKVEDTKAKGAQKKAGGKDAQNEKPAKKQKPVKRRDLEKVTQEYVLGFIKTFILENQSLIHLDLSNTGLDDEGIVELVQLIKMAQEEFRESEPFRLRNLAGLHLSFPNQQDSRQQLMLQSRASLVSEIRDVLKPAKDMPVQQNDSQSTDGNNPNQQPQLQLSEDDKNTVKNQKLAALKKPFSQLDRDTKSYKPAKDGDAYDKQDILCLQRMYNHDEEFESNEDKFNLHQWQLFIGPPSQSCWVCGKHQYTLIFAEVDKELANKAKDIELQLLPNHIAAPNHCVLAMTEKLNLRMEPIRQFSERVDQNYARKFNYLRHFRESAKIDQDQFRVEDLKGEHLVTYRRLLEEYKVDRYEVNWRDVVSKKLDYQHIQVLGDSQAQRTDSKVLLVCAAMLRPGKHQYVIRSKSKKYQSVARTMIGQPRSEPALPNLSEHYYQLRDRDFDHEKSIFSDFKEDDAQLYKQMYEHDMRKWRLTRVVQVEFDYKSIKASIQRNFEQLAKVYQSLAAISDRYPFISYRVFIDFCKATKIVEDATEKIDEDMKRRSGMSNEGSKIGKFKPAYASLTENQAAMCFANTIYDRDQLVKEDQVPMNITDFDERKKMVVQMQIEKLERSSQVSLNRFQFLECLVLIAIEKYHESAVDVSIAVACRRLIDDELQPIVRVVSRNKFRKQAILTKEVDLLLRSNEETLQYAFDKYASSTSTGGKFIPQGKAIYDILGTIFKIGTKKAQVLYARSKMSIANESGNSDAYKRLKFVEFLSLLCLVADLTYRENKTNPPPFHQQLAYILDQLLWRVGLHRNYPKIHWQEINDDSNDEETVEEDLSLSNSEASQRLQKTTKKKGTIKRSFPMKQTSSLNYVIEGDNMSFSSIDLSDEEMKPPLGSDDDDVSPTRKQKLVVDEKKTQQKSAIFEEEDDFFDEDY